MLNSCSENKTLTSCSDGAAQNLKTMDKKVLFKKWFDNFNSKPATTKKVFSEFTISEKEDYLTSNFHELVPKASTKIDAVTKLTASPNVPFDIITKVAKSKGIADADMFTWWGKSINEKATFDIEIQIEWEKASQKAKVSYLQKVSAISESKEIAVPILGGINFSEFIHFAYNKMIQSGSQSTENKETEATEATE